MAPWRSKESKLDSDFAYAPVAGDAEEGKHGINERAPGSKRACQSGAIRCALGLLYVGWPSNGSRTTD